ncbi:hypothetical protein BHE74_00058020 [Ensete ventricosum]|nr:hypothetical protein BHE74_00058020 [Ensete ventricosum]RZS28968.1 hypothetical protein BHM03_00062631 [Ensete ventricosum]
MKEGGGRRMVSGKRESCDERGKREEEGLCDGEGGKGGGRRVRERYQAQSPFADGEEAAASTVRRGKPRSHKTIPLSLSRSLRRRREFHRCN